MNHGWREFRRCLRQDRERLRQFLASAGASRPSVLTLHPSFVCVLLFRIARFLLLRGHPAAARLPHLANLFLTGADLSPQARIGPGLLVIHPAGVTIDGTAGGNLTVDGFGVLMPNHARPEAGGPLAGDGVFVARHGQVIGPLRIGSRVFIPPGHTVAADAADDAVLAFPGKRLLRAKAAALPETDRAGCGCRPPQPCTRHRRFAALREDFAQDIRHYIRHASDYNRGGEGFLKKLSALFTPQVSCIFLYRLAHWLHCNGWPRLAELSARLNTVLHKVTISPASCIGGGLYIPHPVGVAFYGRAGQEVILYAGSACIPDFRQEGCLTRTPALGDGVTIGATAVIWGGVRIGNGCRIGPAAVVTTDVPPGARVLGAGMLGGEKQTAPGR